MFKEARELIATIREKDPAAHGAAEIIFAYPGFHAVMIHRFAHWCAIQGWTAFARWVSQVGRFLTGIEIHPKAKIGRRVFFDHAMGVVIGETAEVGDDCTIYQGVTLGGTNLTAGAKRHPTLENGVVVGAGAKVLGSFTVGAGAQIGSNAVVVKPVPAGATVVGVPGRIAVSKKTPAKAPEPCSQPERERGVHAAAAAFHAYGLEPGMRDPYATSILELVRVVEAQQREIARLSEALASATGKKVEPSPDAHFDTTKLWPSDRAPQQSKNETSPETPDAAKEPTKEQPKAPSDKV